MARVRLFSESPKLSVAVDMIRAVRRPLPRPKFEQLERYGFYDLPKYAGQQPFELPMYCKLGGKGASVEDEIRVLERMMERPEGRDAPPEVKVDGPVPHVSLTWWLVEIAEDEARSEYEWRGEKLHAVTFVATLSLLQRVTDTAGVAVKNAASQKGIGQGTYTVKRDGMDLYDVAEDFYRDSRMAIAISKANPRGKDPMPLGTTFRKGRKLRMP